MSLFSRLAEAFKPAPGAPSHAKPKAVQAKPQPKPQAQSKQPKGFESRPVQPQQPTPQQLVVDETTLREAQTKAREIILEAKDEALKLREQAELKARELNKKSSEIQSQLDAKTHEIDRKEAVLSEKERFLNKIEAEVNKANEEIVALKKQLIVKLEDISSMTTEEAREKLIAAVEKKSARDIALKIKEATAKAEEEADEKAKEILVDSMRHAATDYVAEYSISTVEIPSEDIKGRLIGKEGRNIRAFERATGVDLDLDESPGSVRLSSFDSVRREVARVALKRLIADGRIQPSRIEEFVERTRKDLEKIMFEEGKNLCHAVGAYNVPRELIQYLGRFKYRFSYGQNMIAHTLEETKLGVGLAHEVGANADTVRLGCLFHDIGKVVTDEEGSHVDLGVKLLKKYGMPQPVIDAVAQHHEDTEFTSIESILVYIADAISGARPGARYENYEEYVKRLEGLEKIATDFKGVQEAYAIQAGREIRVIVNPKEMTDDETIVLADKIRDRIRNEMTYPGTVTVNVIREVRSSAVAT